MRGVMFKGDREIVIEDFQDPTPGPGEVVVAIRASGMCGSDLTSYRRPRAEARSVVSGHEPCVVIAEIGPNVSEREARVGQRALIHHYVGCDVCKLRRIGYTQMCERGSFVMGFSTHGGNAPYLSILASQALPSPMN